VEQPSTADQRSYYFCVGIGVGPANLSLASLMHGRPEMPSLFVDKKEAFSWHDGQQIAGTSLQVSMIKDLVSLADPTSPFTFLAYLHAMGRIYHFLNARFDAVSRREFRDYMDWAARNNPNVAFGEEVLSVEFDTAFRIETSRRSVTAQNISIGVGTSPWIPAVAGTLGERSFHVSEYLAKAGDLGGLRVAVIGGGQSGAEAFLDLMSRPAGAMPRRVSWISQRPSYAPLDDSPFTNEYYMPDYSDYFAGLPAPMRRDFNVRNLLTSDGVTESTLRQIYQKIYVHRFLEEAADLVTLFPNREVTGVRGDDANGYQLTVCHNDHPGMCEQLEFDVLVWATGFRSARMEFLGPVAGRMAHEDGEFKIDQSFAACWDGPPQNHIFIQNAARRQRGLADPNLSLLAWRSQRILDRLAGTDTRPMLPSFVEWTSKPSVGSSIG
jgi:lysine N6-hydroxylase